MSNKINIRLFNDDCFNILPRLIEEKVKVDMVFVDLPYGETGNQWDKQINNYELMFQYLEELIRLKENNKQTRII